MYMKKEVYILLSPELACRNVKKILTSANLDNYNAAAVTLRWQFAISTVLSHTEKHNMVSIFYMPNMYIW